MKFVVATIIVGLAFALQGCSERHHRVVFSVCADFSGLIEVKKGTNGTDARSVNDSVLVYVPQTGKVIVSDDSFLKTWNHWEATYSNGHKLSVNLGVDANEPFWVTRWVAGCFATINGSARARRIPQSSLSPLLPWCGLVRYLWRGRRLPSILDLLGDTAARFDMAINAFVLMATTFTCLPRPDDLTFRAGCRRF